jgi:hypothetical protein
MCDMGKRLCQYSFVRGAWSRFCLIAGSLAGIIAGLLPSWVRLLSYWVLARAFVAHCFARWLVGFLV